jgi:hypothetical protein
VITLRFPDAWNWLRSGLLDITDDGKVGRPIREIEIDGETHRLVGVFCDWRIGLGEVTLTYEHWTKATEAL